MKKLWLRVLRKVAVEGMLLLTASLVLGYVHFQQADPLWMTSGKTEPPIKIERIHEPEELFEMIETGNILCIDARDIGEYESGHIQGAICLPLSTLDRRLAENLSLFTQNKKIVIYCSGLECELSELLARKLYAVGFDQIWVFEGGIQTWKEANLPIKESI